MAAIALGQSSAAADALFEQGRAALAAGDYETACKRLRESDRLDPAVGTKLNLAACEEKRGKIATAWALFRTCVAQLRTGDERLPIAQQRAAALERRLPHVTLRLARGAPPETTVRDGEVELSAASFGIALPRDPGPHELSVRAPGHAPRVVHFRLSESERLDVEVSPGASVRTPAPMRDRAQDSASPGTQRTLGYALGGIGIAGLVVGGVTTAILIEKKDTVSDHCDDLRHTCDQEGLDASESGRTLAPISTAAWIVGFAGLGAGAYLVLSSKHDSETRVSAKLSRSGAGVSLLQRF